MIKFEAIAEHACKLELHFKDIFLLNELYDFELCKSSAAVQIRWYSFYGSASVSDKKAVKFPPHAG